MFELWPGPTGAHSWQPQAYSPRTGLVYVPVIQQGALIGEGKSEGALSGIGVSLIPEAELPGGRHSFLRAWNPVTQSLAWEKSLPGAWPGGVLATAGDLVFQGHLDHSFVAYDAKTGKQLWAYKAESSIVGAPISYRLNGKQYIAVITGTGGEGATTRSLANQPWRTDYQFPRHVLSFALGGTDRIEPTPLPDLVIPEDPSFKRDPELEKTAATVFATSGCMGCHGWTAVAGGGAPDLRYSPIIVDPAAFKNVVKGGALKANGMPQFADMTDAKLETIRYYLRMRSKQAPAEREAAIRKANLKP
jgi:quinohemoprotein ethanol dehydrogenase